NDCTQALSLGVGLLGPIWNGGFAAKGMTSTRGRCHTFDSRADGYARGEGCSLLLLHTEADTVSCLLSAAV
ncbi:hypothetical protein AURANDRAFT_32785, partial [Aureococcus anophagefferens]